MSLGHTGAVHGIRVLCQFVKFAIFQCVSQAGTAAQLYINPPHFMSMNAVLAGRCRIQLRWLTDMKSLMYHIPHTSHTLEQRNTCRGCECLWLCSAQRRS